MGVRIRKLTGKLFLIYSGVDKKWIITLLSLSTSVLLKHVYYLKHTFKFSHPSSNPSSIALIPLPLRSISCRCVRPLNSVVENIGFSVSPSRLSASLNSTREDLRLCSILSVRRLKELPERSILRRGSSVDENIYRKKVDKT